MTNVFQNIFFGPTIAGVFFLLIGYQLINNVSAQEGIPVTCVPNNKFEGVDSDKLIFPKIVFLLLLCTYPATCKTTLYFKFFDQSCVIGSKFNFDDQRWVLPGYIYKVLRTSDPRG